MERTIGETFIAGGHKYECVSETRYIPGCKHCAMYTDGTCVASSLGAGECAELSRSDKMSVRFIEISKV